MFITAQNSKFQVSNNDNRAVNLFRVDNEKTRMVFSLLQVFNKIHFLFGCS